MTMGFDLPDSAKEGLPGLVRQMWADNYLPKSMPKYIPIVGMKKGGIVYGPLANFAG